MNLKRLTMKFRKGLILLVPFYKSIGMKLFLFYTFSIFLVAILLSVPGISKDGTKAVSFDDALFISTSSFTDTGLTTLNISQQFNIGGQIIIMIAIQLGGMGLFSVKYLLWFWILRRTNLKSDMGKEGMHVEKGGTKRRTSSTVIRKALYFFLGVILFYAVILFIYFSTTSNFSSWNPEVDNVVPNVNSGASAFYGLFHSVSTLNNAGFDIFGGRSLGAFQHDQFIQTTTLIFFIVGGIGFPVLYDSFAWIKRKFRNKKGPKLALLSKITYIAYLSVSLLGIGLTTLSEYIYSVQFDSTVKTGVPLFNDNNFSPYERWMNIVFHSSSTRSAGFAFYPMQNYAPSTRVIYSLLMFIGAGPSSTGGGIRVTSLAVLFILFIKFSKNGSQVNIFKRTIHRSNTRSAYRTIVSSAVIVAFISVLVTVAASNLVGEAGAEGLVFEVISAFGTTGLSVGVTSSLGVFSKLCIGAIMIVGQLGMNNVLILFRRQGNVKKKRIKNYPIEKVTGI